MKKEMKKVMKQFDDFEIECNPNIGVILTIFPVEHNSKIKTDFDIEGIIVKYMKTKGWEYI